MDNDFQKLVVAKKYISALKDEIGHLNGELADANAEIKRLKFDLTQKEKLRPEEKLAIRIDEKNQWLTKKNKELFNELNACKADKEKLILKLNQPKS
ncbi:hypothetical protein [Roseivirga misakiensis]|uniref:Uncharacterized protein n=1 Tax=Roseivirga misakiensis TaxID=1563681 RepID=A0A1E5T1Q6_9BACT|nr:hypothetical protein [Roseivirga misakiensis]OEK05313.1 hypothetical protein BFP71_18125 [Roseivirga misakiensis]